MVINRDIQISINKADATRVRQLVFFSNTGDNDLAWQYDRTSNNGSGAIEWSVSPTRGNLTTCDVGNVTLELDFAAVQARADPYVLVFTMASSSYLEASRAIPIELSMTVSALASAERCTVDLKNTENLAVADTVAFYITSIDQYGIRILDVAALTYSATLGNDKMLDYDIPCTVAYRPGSDRHGGHCILPTHAWGNFVLTVLDSVGELVGAQTYNISVTRCSKDYYWDGGSCIECNTKEVICRKGSTLETVLLKSQHWRQKESTPIDLVRHCDRRPENCLGTANATTFANMNATMEGSTFRQGCVEGALGPLCASCKAGWTQSSDLECTECDTRAKMYGKIVFGVLLGTLLVVSVLVATIGQRLLPWLSSGDVDSGTDEADSAHKSQMKELGVLALLIWSTFETIKDASDKVRDKGKILITYFQIVSQQVGGCITAPWPSSYGVFIEKLHILSLNLVPYFSASCLFPRANLYHQCLFSTAGPIVVTGAIFAYYLARRGTSTVSHQQLREKVASYALAVSYFVLPSGSLMTFRLFARDTAFEHGQCFLKYDYSCSCSSSVYLFGWRPYGRFA